MRLQPHSTNTVNLNLQIVSIVSFPVSLQYDMAVKFLFADRKALNVYIRGWKDGGVTPVETEQTAGHFVK